MTLRLTAAALGLTLAASASAAADEPAELPGHRRRRPRLLRHRRVRRRDRHAQPRRARRDGLRLTDFHTAPTCSPTRSMLLTGHRQPPGRARRRWPELLTPNQKRQAGLRGLPATPRWRRLAGAAAGRRLPHADGRQVAPRASSADQDPHARGFEHELRAAARRRTTISAPTCAPDPRERRLSRDGVTIASCRRISIRPTIFTDKLIDQIKREQRRARRRGSRSSPISPSPRRTGRCRRRPRTIAKYRGRYDAGYEALRARSGWSGRRELGLLDATVQPHPAASITARSWDSLDAGGEARSRPATMEIYAAMVDRLDQQRRPGDRRRCKQTRRVRQHRHLLPRRQRRRGTRRRRADAEGPRRRRDDASTTMGSANSYVELRAGLGAGGDGAVMAVQGLRDRGRHPRGRRSSPGRGSSRPGDRRGLS